MGKRKKDRSLAERRKEFIEHLRLYLVISIFLCVLNVATSRGDFWAIWPIMGWGIAVLIDGLSVYGPLRDREDEEFESDDFFDINHNKPTYQTRREHSTLEPNSYREEDLI